MREPGDDFYKHGSTAEFIATVVVAAEHLPEDVQFALLLWNAQGEGPVMRTTATRASLRKAFVGPHVGEPTRSLIPEDESVVWLFGRAGELGEGLPPGFYYSLSVFDDAGEAAHVAMSNAPDAERERLLDAVFAGEVPVYPLPPPPGVI